ncbi:hypothetical protein NPIL_441291, partial [Nephila pilipes]
SVLPTPVPAMNTYYYKCSAEEAEAPALHRNSPPETNRGIIMVKPQGSRETTSSDFSYHPPKGSTISCQLDGKIPRF